MKHKQYEVLLAIAEGKEVEYRHCGVWYSHTISDFNPITSPSLEWRVKLDMDAVIDEAFYSFTRGFPSTANTPSCSTFKAGFLAGVKACQNGEYY